MEDIKQISTIRFRLPSLADTVADMVAGPEDSAQRPAIGVSVLVRGADGVLLVRRGRPPLAGLWSLPGGRVEFGERLEEAAIREIREETGIDIEGLVQIDVAEIIGRQSDGGIEDHFVLIVFEGSYLSGTIAAGDDAAEARWVSPRDWPELDMTKDTRRVLQTFGFGR